MVNQKRKSQRFPNFIDKVQDKFDFFGQGVNFTYKGKDSFTTRPGCVVSVILGIFILAVTILKTIQFYFQDQAF